MDLVLFGANGATGRLLTRQLIDAVHLAVAVNRRPGDFPFTDPPADDRRGRCARRINPRQRHRLRRRRVVHARRAVHPITRRPLYWHPQHRYRHAPHRNPAARRGQYHRRLSLATSTQRRTILADLRAPHHPHPRQYGLRRHPPHGDHRAKQRAWTGRSCDPPSASTSRTARTTPPDALDTWAPSSPVSTSPTTPPWQATTLRCRAPGPYRRSKCPRRGCV